MYHCLNKAFLVLLGNKCINTGVHYNPSAMKDVRKSDNAVSEIIGAILLFAIASVLLTSFILWYVPSTGTNNDLSYQGGTQNSFSSLDSKMLSSSLTPGSAISQSFPLGISGTPPFTPTQSTNLHYSSNFNATMHYNMTVNYTNLITKKTVKVAACANASSSNILNNNYVDTQFKFAVNFQETGLPAGYYWTVTIGGTQESGSPIGSHFANVISFSLARGTYSYSVSSDNKTDLPSPAVGTVKVTNGGTTVPVTFASDANIQRSVVAASFGSTKDVNAINSANFIGVVTQSNICGITYPDYWLNNTALPITENNKVFNYYPLASQQFFVYQKDTPISYLKFYLEPNIVYYEQEYQGVADLFISISTHPYSTATPLAFAFTNISTNNHSGAFTNSSCLENLSLKSPGGGSIVLNKNGSTNTYYINFFEAVNESSTNHIRNGDGSLIFENKNTGYGYGPNEFIGTITNPSISVNAGISYYFEATSSAKEIDEKKFFGLCITPGSTAFHITSEQLYTSYSPYYFFLGYNIPSSNNNGKIIVKETGINLTNNPNWNFYLGTTDYQTTGSNTFTVPDLPSAQFNYSVKNVAKLIPNPQSGFISIIPKKTAYINITFFQPVGSLPSYWDMSDKAVQNFTLKSPAEINFLSLYFFNFTIPPGNGAGNTPTYYAKITLFNVLKHQQINCTTIKVSATGWTQVFLTSQTNGYKPIKVPSGSYEICVQDVNSKGESEPSSGAIGWGFATMGGYDNYLQRVTSDSLTSSLGTGTQSCITPYNSNSPPTPMGVTNQTYMYSIGYYNVTVSREVVPYLINVTSQIQGSLNSEGQTQFTLTRTGVLQDGIVLSAGKGVTYVTINPLPVRIVNSSLGISLSSIAYGMNLSKGTPSSVSGSGSTIVSMTMLKQKLTNYTVGNSYAFNNRIGVVKNIKLTNYSYIIHSSYAKYWADTLFTELLGSPNGQNYTHFTLLKHFKFDLDGGTESITQTDGSVPLYSANFETVNFNINSI